MTLYGIPSDVMRRFLNEYNLCIGSRENVRVLYCNQALTDADIIQCAKYVYANTDKEDFLLKLHCKFPQLAVEVANDDNFGVTLIYLYLKEHCRVLCEK